MIRKVSLLFAIIAVCTLISANPCFSLDVPSVDYPTIQAAIDAVRSGDTVQVAAGTYNGNITLKSGVTVQEEGAADWGMWPNHPAERVIRSFVVLAVGADKRAEQDTNSEWRVFG
jgi:hypothetical protein